MQTRLCEALQQIGSSAPDPRIGMLVGGFVKHLSRNPIGDEDIRASLEWVTSLVDSILKPDEHVTPDLPDVQFSMPGM